MKQIPANGTNPPEIPVGLYVLLAILAFPIGTVVAAGFFWRQKYLFQSNQLEKLARELKVTKVVSIILIIPFALVLMYVVGMMRMIL
ncbi:MAG: hypothetical protein IH614_16155 [Desulfuromonadales bacterium]|nr:hypothetical protein [Desulfuromonadales bacterium]